jgi:hypothetical protein
MCNILPFKCSCRVQFKSSGVQFKLCSTNSVSFIKGKNKNGQLALCLWPAMRYGKNKFSWDSLQAHRKDGVTPKKLGSCSITSTSDLWIS